MHAIKVQIIVKLRSFLTNSISQKETYFSSDRDFTRQGKLGFFQTAVCCLFLLKKSLSLELDDFFEILGKSSDSCTKSAFSQARYKIKAIFFQHWQEALSTAFYELIVQQGHLKTWHGLQVHAIDGTTAYLFNKGDIGPTFGYHSNQHGVRIPMGRIVVRYDVLHKIAVKGTLQGIGKCERIMAYELLSGASPHVVSLYDRHFHSFAFMYAHQERSLPFVMRGRCRENWLKDFLKTKLDTQIVTLRAKSTDIAQAEKNFGFQLQKQDTMSVRLIRVELQSGEVEVLITNLLDQSYPTQDFKALYGLRWGEETYFDVLKNKLQLEIFSGYSAQAIQQDFYALLLISSLQAILCPHKEALKHINEHRTATYTVNQSYSLGIMKKMIPRLFLTDDFDQVINNFEAKCLKHLEPVRPNRHFTRTKHKQRLTGKFKTITNFKRAV